MAPSERGKDTATSTTEPADFETSGSFGGAIPPPQQNNLNVTVNTDSVNIHASNLSALERICADSPQLAGKIIDSTDNAARLDYKRYRVGAISAAAIAIIILLCCTAVIISQGFWAGIAFFMVCAAVAAIISAIFTGKSQDLSWTIGLLGRGEDSARKED